MGPDDVFRALAEPTRRALVEALAHRGPSTATELAADMPISRQAVAKHLHHLQRAALVTSVRTGREIRYHLTVTPLARAVDWLEDVCGQVRRAA